ncbi:MAG: DUF1724 domain-containing protein [Methanotrichaceae archaeon]|nr:DUF1724 domain-containing protein [Methanotrichaceae archaeon]
MKRIVVANRACEFFDLAEGQLKGFTRSGVRTKVLLCLEERAKTAAELEDEIGIRTSTILHSIKDMMEHNLIGKSGQGYFLTNIGKIQAKLLDDLISAMVILDQYKDFWLTHDISGIPENLLLRIGVLSQSQILSADPAALLKVYENFISELLKSENIYGVSPIVLPEYANAIAAAVNNGAKVELILTENVMKIVLKDHYIILKNLLEHEDFKLYKINHEVKVAFTVTDSLISLGLFGLDGVYDMVEDLICTGKKAQEWGMELFNYYLDKLTRVLQI